MSIDQHVVCSSITFRKLPLEEALATIASLGFEEIDLGALPGVCDHVPYELDESAVRAVSERILESGLRVRSVNGDVGDLNASVTASEAASRIEHLNRLLDLCQAVAAPALVLPCGSLGKTPLEDFEADVARVAECLRAFSAVAEQRGLQIWDEVLHSGRLCFDLERATQLVSALEGSGVGVVMDFSHIVASGDDPVGFVDRFGPQIVHVHIRDAQPGNIHLSVGRGDVDFGTGIVALQRSGYEGRFSLELETRDVEDSERPRAAQEAGEYISRLLTGVTK